MSMLCFQGNLRQKQDTHWQKQWAPLDSKIKIWYPFSCHKFHLRGGKLGLKVMFSFIYQNPIMQDKSPNNNLFNFDKFLDQFIRAFFCNRELYMWARIKTTLCLDSTLKRAIQIVLQNLLVWWRCRIDRGKRRGGQGFTDSLEGMLGHVRHNTTQHDATQHTQHNSLEGTLGHVRHNTTWYNTKQNNTTVWRALVTA